MLKTLLRRGQDESEALEMCRKCYAFRQSNSWHMERPEYFLENEVEEKIVRFILCPACTEEAEEIYRMGYDMEYI